MTEYFIPTGASETELVEKRSRFLGHVWPVESEGEARARIEEIRKKHYDARHHCWCYRIREGGVAVSYTHLDVYKRQVHAFCAQLLRECGHLLELDPDFRLCDEGEAGILMLRALNDVLDLSLIHI